MKKHITLMVLLAGICTGVQSQSLSPTVIPADGGTGIAGDISLAWTLGELSTESISTGSYLHTEGFHQPMLSVEVVELEDEQNALSDNSMRDAAPTINVFPNPVRGLLNIDIDGGPGMDLRLQLFDINGKLIMQKNADAGNRSLLYDMSNYVDGLYVLHFENDAGEAIKSYQIVKTQ